MPTNTMPEQPAIPGTEHKPTAKELAIRPFAIKAALARQNYQAAGRAAKEMNDALEGVMQLQGLRTANCGDGIIVTTSVKERVEVEVPEDSPLDWQDPLQTAIDGTERNGSGD